MNERQALKILLTYIACNCKWMGCDTCPAKPDKIREYGECFPYDDEKIIDAFELLQKKYYETEEQERQPEHVAEREQPKEQPGGDWREWILAQARNAVCTDRNKQYGEPEDSFAAIASLWTAYFHASRKMPEGEEIYNNDAALMLALFKIAREITAITPNPDSYADLAGYAACAGECALKGDGQTLINLAPSEADSPEEAIAKYAIYNGLYDKFNKSEIETRKE